MFLDLRQYPILYVDDEPENLVTFRYMFDEEFSVLTARSAAEAIELLRRHDIAVLLSDQRMPKMTGVELCEIARVERPEAVRMIVTAYADLHAAIDAINKGQVSRYLLKPWRHEELADMLRTAIEFFHLQRGVQELEERLLCAGPSQVAAATRAAFLHELRDPLESLVSSLRRSERLLGELQRRMRNQADGAVVRLIDEVVDLQREALGSLQALSSTAERVSRPPPRLSGGERCDLGRVASATAQLARGEVERVAALECVVDASPQAAIDPSVLGQLVLDLILSVARVIEDTRARDAAITVRVGRVGLQAVIAISARAVAAEGATPLDLLEAVSILPAPGPGLGLAVARELAEQHGAELRVVRDPGQPPRFELRVLAL